MDKLPQELIDRISDYLALEQLNHTLTVNRKFQNAAERLSGAFNDFELNEETGERFLHTYSSRRFQYLRKVFFKVTLPAPTAGETWDHLADSNNLPCRESEEELRMLDEEFTRQIYFLFSTLEILEKNVGENYGSGKIQLTLGTPTIEEIDRDKVCFHRIFPSWRIHVLTPEKLPELRSVCHLHIENLEPYDPFNDSSISFRPLDLRVLLDLSNKLPNLEILSCAIGGNEWPVPLSNEGAKNLMRIYQGLTRDSRHGFSDALHTLVSLPSLREAQLNFIDPFTSADFLDQRVAMPNLTAPLLHDPFSSSIRLLSYQLRRLCLFAVVDKTLFWPSDNSAPYWPYLESINIKFHMTSPSGAWYFGGLEGEGCIEGYDLDADSYPPYTTTDDDLERDTEAYEIEWDAITRAQFRVLPNNNTLVPFFSAFAKATSFMPLLKEAALWCPLRFDVGDMGGFYENYDVNNIINNVPDETGSEELAWGIAYTKPGERAFNLSPGKDYSNSRQIWYKIGKSLPSKEFHKAVQQIGIQQHGTNLIEYWDDEYDGDGLVKRSVFEEYEWRTFPRFS